MFDNEAWKIDFYLCIKQLHGSQIKIVSFSSPLPSKYDSYVDYIKIELMERRYFFLKNTPMLDQIWISKKLSSDSQSISHVI